MLDAGAETDVVNSVGRTAAQMAAFVGMSECDACSFTWESSVLRAREDKEPHPFLSVEDWNNRVWSSTHCQITCIFHRRQCSLCRRKHVCSRNIKVAASIWTPLPQHVEHCSYFHPYLKQIIFCAAFFCYVFVENTQRVDLTCVLELGSESSPLSSSGQHDCVTVINNYFSRARLDYYTKPQGLEKEPKLPPKLAGPLHKIIMGTNLNPVKVGGHCSGVISVLQDRCTFQVIRF